MKHRCHNDFRFTLQKWLGSSRCSPHVGASPKPGGQEGCSTSDVQFSCIPALIIKLTDNDSDVNLMHTTYLESFCCQSKISQFQLRHRFFYHQLWFTTFAHTGSWLVIWLVSGNSFRHSFIERGHAVWVRVRVCFWCGCVCVCGCVPVSKIERVWDGQREKESKTQSLS